MVLFHFHTGHVVFIPGMLFFPVLLICQNQNIPGMLFFPVLLICQNQNMICVKYPLIKLTMATNELMV